MDVIPGARWSPAATALRSSEFLRVLIEVDVGTPKGLDLHLVVDNYLTDKTPVVRHESPNTPRVVLHFTPTSACWRNLVERWFAELTRRNLPRSRHRSFVELERDIVTSTQDWNKDPKSFVWTKSADAIPDTLAGYRQRISDSRHYQDLDS